MKNLVHLQHPQFEVILSLDQIAYANRIDNALWLHFAGVDKPLQLRDAMADVVWKILCDSKLTVYIAPEIKNAETPSEQGSGELSNEVHDTH